MTAQAGERLIFKGEETWMAAEPLNQYLQNRNDINFVSPSTACWRGYYGQWEIKDNKLYLIELKAYLEGYREVGLDYLFPRQNTVFANWFSGKIRIPQGEMLDYVHMGYASLYERDLILVFENGLLTNEYIVDNEDEYQNRIEKREKQEIEQAEKEVKKKKKDKIKTVIIIVSFVLALIGICFGVNHLVQQHTILTNLFSAIIISPLLLIIGGVIFLIANKGKNEQKEDKAVAFVGINFLVLVFIGICIGIFYLIKWGTMLAYFISATIIIGLLYLIFLAVKNQIQKKNY
jgi:preprotein translocase subunit SecE